MELADMFHEEDSARKWFVGLVWANDRYCPHCGNTEKQAQVYTDGAAGYRGVKRKHEAFAHPVGEYVREQAHTNGKESFWATLKRAHKGTYHEISEKHLIACLGKSVSTALSPVLAVSRESTFVASRSLNPIFGNTL